MPQVILLVKMPCDSTSWTGTQVANHSWPLVLAKLWTESPGNVTPPIHEPGAEGHSTHAQWAEQYTYQHRETDDQQGRPPRPRPPLHPGKVAQWIRDTVPDSLKYCCMTIIWQFIWARYAIVAVVSLLYIICYLSCDYILKTEQDRFVVTIEIRLSDSVVVFLSSPDTPVRPQLL